MLQNRFGMMFWQHEHILLTKKDSDSSFMIVFSMFEVENFCFLDLRDNKVSTYAIARYLNPLSFVMASEV